LYDNDAKQVNSIYSLLSVHLHISREKNRYDFLNNVIIKKPDLMTYDTEVDLKT